MPGCYSGLLLWIFPTSTSFKLQNLIHHRSAFPFHIKNSHFPSVIYCSLVIFIHFSSTHPYWVSVGFVLHWVFCSCSPLFWSSLHYCTSQCLYLVWSFVSYLAMKNSLSHFFLRSPSNLLFIQFL